MERADFTSVQNVYSLVYIADAAVSDGASVGSIRWTLNIQMYNSSNDTFGVSL